MAKIILYNKNQLLIPLFVLKILSFFVEDRDYNQIIVSKDMNINENNHIYIEYLSKLFLDLIEFNNYGHHLSFVINHDLTWFTPQKIRNIWLFIMTLEIYQLSLITLKTTTLKCKFNALMTLFYLLGIFCKKIIIFCK